MLKRCPNPSEAIVGQSVLAWLNITIVYEDPLTFRVAERISDGLVVAADSGCCVRLTMRSFDVLGIRSIRELAVAEAKEADLLLFSIYEHGEWPAGVARWMELLCSEPMTQHGGFAALLVKSPFHPPDAAGRRGALEQMASNCGRDFFIAKDVWLGRPEHYPAYE